MTEPLAETPDAAAVHAAISPPVGVIDPATGIVHRVRLGAYALIEEDDRILLCRLSPADPDTGAWTLPGGGLEFGEDPEAGALRELEEETGYWGELTGLLGIASFVMEPSETISGHRLHVVQIVYRARIAGGELRHEVGGSTDEAAWIPRDDVPRLPVVELVPYALSL